MFHVQNSFECLDNIHTSNMNVELILITFTDTHQAKNCIIARKHLISKVTSRLIYYMVWGQYMHVKYILRRKKSIYKTYTT